MKKNIVILIIVVLMVSMTSMALLFHGEGRNSRISYGNGVKADSPIRINNDTDLQAQAANNGWTGDGTELNPYVIENYQIDVGTARNGIYLGNTTLYVIIRNSEIYNVSGPISSSGDGAAISFVNSQNLTIENVYIHESEYYGIYVAGSFHILVKNNRIENNTMTSSSYGIRIEGIGSDVVVRDNYLYTTNPHATGIYFYSFDYSRIINNTIIGFRNAAIDLSYSPYATLWSNKMYGCSVAMEGYSEEHYNHTIPLNNTVNDDPIYYYLSMNLNNASLSPSGNVGELILINVSNAIINDMEINHTSISFLLTLSHNIWMRNISAGDTGSFAFYFGFSDNFTVENSSVTGSLSSGIYIYQVNDIIFSNVTVTHCNSNGMYFYHSYRVSIYNLRLLNDYYGFSIYNDYFYKNQYTIIENSRFENMTQYLTKFWYALNIVINKSYFAHGGAAIWLNGFDDNTTITNNTIIDVSSYGIYAAHSNNMRVENNSMVGCANEGIYMQYQENARIAYNYIDNSYGLDLLGINDSVIMNNTIKNSHRYGVGIYGGTSHLGWNTVVGNLVENSSSYGIYLNGTTENLLYNNTLKYNNGATDNYDSSHVQAWDDYTGNRWNTSGNPHGYGNYWSDWTTPDNDGDGIVDNPYTIDGGVGAQDSNPLASSPYIPEFQLSYLLMAIFGIALIVVRRRRQN